MMEPEHSDAEARCCQDTATPESPYLSQRGVLHIPPGLEWPGTINTTGLMPMVEHVHPSQNLNPEQRARSEAIYDARGVLERKGAMNTENPGSTDDMIRVANWIITGEDPL